MQIDSFQCLFVCIITVTLLWLFSQHPSSGRNSSKVRTSLLPTRVTTYVCIERGKKGRERGSKVRMQWSQTLGARAGFYFSHFPLPADLLHRRLYINLPIPSQILFPKTFRTSSLLAWTASAFQGKNATHGKPCLKMLLYFTLPKVIAFCSLVSPP